MGRPINTKSNKRRYKNNDKKKSVSLNNRKIVTVNKVNEHNTVAHDVKKSEVVSKPAQFKKPIDEKPKKKNSSIPKVFDISVISVGKFISSLFKASVDTERYKYRIVENFGRAEKFNTATVTCSIQSIIDPKMSSVIMATISKDLPTKLINVSILDTTNNISPSMLFNSLAKDPRHKMEKYIPNIIVSTQDKIK